MNILQQTRQNKSIRTFVRKTISGALTLLLASLSGLPEQYVALTPFLYAIIDMSIKHINVKHLGDLGVDK